MSRRCACARLLHAVQSDPRLRTLPLAARMLFLLLGEAMIAAGTPGELPFSETARVSLLVSAPQTEVETQIETLLAERLLERSGGLLLCPLLAAPPARARTAQLNGQQGGRPRRGETAEQARARRSQGHFALPIMGGVETQETQTAKPVPLIIEDESIHLSSSSGIQTPRAKQIGPAEVLALANDLACAAGMDPARSTWTAREVEAWLAAGASPALCRDVVADVMSRCRTTPGSFAYFRKAVTAAIAAEAAVPVAAPRTKRDTPLGRWAAALEAHEAAGGLPERFPGLEAWQRSAA